jgi:hypothetical protein
MFLMTVLAAAQAQDRGARPDDVAPDSDVYEPAPRDRLFYSHATYLRVNPLGLVDLARVGWQRRLSSQDSLLLRDTYTFVGPNVMLTPAYARLGGYAEAQLLAVLRVFGSVEGVAYFGTFDQVLSFPDAGARYSDQTMADLGSQGLHSPRLGWVSTVGATLQAAVGPLAVRSTPQLTRYDLALPEGHVAFYDQYWDRLAPDRGLMILDDTDLLLLLGKVRTGMRYTFSDHVGPAEGDAGLAHHRLGPMFAVQLHNDPPGTRFNQPTLFVLTQWWLQHPYRTGEEQPGALPLVALGFAFNGDLAP